MPRRSALFCALLVVLVVGAAAPGLAGERHRTTVTLRLTGSLIATGQVRAPDGTRACENGREVLIQRRISGNWRTVERRDARPRGDYRIPLNNVAGSYRAVVRPLNFRPGEHCGRDISPTERHGDGGGNPERTLRAVLVGMLREADRGR